MKTACSLRHGNCLLIAVLGIPCGCDYSPREPLWKGVLEHGARFSSPPFGARVQPVYAMTGGSTSFAFWVHAKLDFIRVEVHYDKVFDVLGKSAELTSQSPVSRASERDLTVKRARGENLNRPQYWRLAEQDIDGPGPLTFSREKKGAWPLHQMKGSALQARDLTVLAARRLDFRSSAEAASPQRCTAASPSAVR